MSTWRPRSCLAPQIERLVQLRRLSGTDYRSQADLLACFDRFLVEHRVHRPRITRALCDRYLQSLSRLAPRTQANRFSVVRQLSAYLARSDPLGFIPEPLRAPSSFQAHRAYVFSESQIQSLLTAALRLPPPKSLRPHTYHTLLGLMYTTGIRIGEARALNMKHFLPAERRLYIAEGKFRKTRWVALSSSTNTALRWYVERRRKKTPHTVDSPFFLNERHRQLSYPTVRATFHRLLADCGIPRHSHSGPRIHDLRHTFAVHRLLAWYRDGEDVNARLPLLATYMGHVDVNSTRIYLQPTAELLGEVQRRFHQHYLAHRD